MNASFLSWLAMGLGLAGCVMTGQVARARTGPEAVPIWEQARRSTRVHRFSTLFTAQNVRDFLSSEPGIEAALKWCRRTAVTRVYLEVFRDGYQAERSTLLHAKARFLEAGFQVAGCVTTTRIGKPSTGWKGVISCYTDPATQQRVRAIFQYAAGLFDEIMIDDFWFTDCTGEECNRARRARVVTVGGRRFPVQGDRWEDYRRTLMVQLSREDVVHAARAVNPAVKIILKYPQWYDRFHERGYDVARETAVFDRIWVGTETRDYEDPRWGGTVQYEGYFIMRWLGDLGGEKCGGGWFDWLGTTPKTYVEQARQTVLAGARESMLFCYGGLQKGTGPEDVAALRENIPELLRIAREVHGRHIIGVGTYKPPNSHPGKEPRVFDFAGMLGLPLVPGHEFPLSAPAAFFSVHALKDPRFKEELTTFLAAGKPVLLTDGLAARLKPNLDLDLPNVRFLPVNGEPKSLLELPRAKLDALRQFVLGPLRFEVSAPNRVAVYLFDDRSWVVENFNDHPVEIQLNGRGLSVPARDWVYQWNGGSK